MDLALFNKYLEEVRELARANERIAIHASLEAIFTEGVKAAPRVIVELGVSSLALANKVLGMIARMNNAAFYSCDIEDFSGACDYSKWIFLKGDDVELAEYWFGGPIDLLFIDTNELYHHVRDEIVTWFPKLSPHPTVMFRCSNLQKTLAYKDGRTTGLGWDNERGVIRAIEDILKISFDETKPYEGEQEGWKVKHWPWGGGLTVLRGEP